MHWEIRTETLGDLAAYGYGLNAYAGAADIASTSTCKPWSPNWAEASSTSGVASTAGWSAPPAVRAT